MNKTADRWPNSIRIRPLLHLPGDIAIRRVCLLVGSFVNMLVSQLIAVLAGRRPRVSDQHGTGVACAWWRLALNNEHFYSYFC